MQQPPINGTTPIAPIIVSPENGASNTTVKMNTDEDDDDAVFVNNTIELDVDFEQSAKEKRDATIDGRSFSILGLKEKCNISLSDEPMPGNDANSPSITNQLRNEELQRKKAMGNNYDMFADDEDYQDTNVSKKK